MHVGARFAKKGRLEQPLPVLGPVERRGLFEAGKRPYLWQAKQRSGHRGIGRQVLPGSSRPTTFHVLIRGIS